jgi:hypothetical protein
VTAQTHDDLGRRAGRHPIADSRPPQVVNGEQLAALAYYHAHRDEIQRQMSDDEEFVENLRRTDPRASRKPTDTDALGNPLSP